MEQINFSQQYITIDDLLIKDILKINNEKKGICSNVKSSLLVKGGLEHMQLLQRDDLLNSQLSNIKSYRVALLEATREKREICLINYLS